MADVMTCPDPSTLEGLLSGLEPEDQAVDLEQHVLGCQYCCRVMRDLAAACESAQLGAARAAAELGEEQVVKEVANRVATLRMPERAPSGEETLASDSDTQVDALDFRQVLDAPQLKDEIGRFGGYRVLRALGAGGMGVVWEAEDPQLRRRIALKIMKPSLTGQREHRERFLREARAAAAIDHSHIVTVYQVGEHRGLPFLAMQLLRGETLDDRLRRERRLPVAECLRIGRQMAEALGVAHRRGLIHRDIKPANTWLEEDGGWVKLVDFGLAHALADESHLTQTGILLGTPAFMSPEQARGDAVDARSDLFSLGAVLYRMATGVGPFDGPSTLSVLTSLALRTPEPPRDINPDLSPEFSDLIMRLLAKNPGDRPVSAEPVAEEIRVIEAELVERNSFRYEAIASAGMKQRNEFRSTNKRLPLVIAAALAALLAAIVIIIRNKQGDEIARIDSRDGHSAEIKPSDGRAKSIDKGSLGARAPADEKDAGLQPSVIPDAPSLEEWLEGRTVLTVSQDGQGRFKTIQSALDALQPGQVIEVLDRGPYRETLLARGPKDAGLISRAGTVIEPGEKRKPLVDGDTGTGLHHFYGVRQFRFSGLAFAAGELRHLGPTAIWINIGIADDLLIENCRFSSERSTIPDPFIYWDAAGVPGAVCHVRECVFETAPTICVAERGQRPVAIIERNWFRSAPQSTSLVIQGRGQRVVIRHNIFDSRQPTAITLMDNDGMDLLEISNNTMLLGNIAFERLSPTVGMVRNNLFCEGVMATGDGGQASVAPAAQRWQIGGNEYVRAPQEPNQLPQTAGDFVGEPRFLSRDPTDPDYLRIASGSDEAHRGTGGAWPAYLGALPPGPAPADGDWLTRRFDTK